MKLLIQFISISELLQSEDSEKHLQFQQLDKVQSDVTNALTFILNSNLPELQAVKIYPADRILEKRDREKAT